MIEHLVTYMQLIISEYGAWGVFVATLIEEIIAPVPSPIVPLAGGFFLLSAGLSFAEVVVRSVLLIALPVSIGISLGSAVVYALGFFGGKPVIEKSGKWTGIKWRDIEEAEARLSRGRRDEITLFTLRILPIVPGVAISGLCGAVRYPFKKFITITYLGAFVRAFVLGILGWQVGEVYATYADMISKYEKYILLGVVLIVLLVLGYYVVKRYTRTQQA
jgi:membrane protein DedA with SNARE-associated domain